MHVSCADSRVHRVEVARQRLQLLCKNTVGIKVSVREADHPRRRECHLGRPGCHGGNGKRAAEFPRLAVRQAACAKVPASAVTVKQLMFVTGKSASLPLPLLTRSACPRGSAEEIKNHLRT